MNVHNLDVVISQKRRGGKGKYEVIQEDDAVRVDKNKGKILKMHLSSDSLDFKTLNFSVQLVLLSESEPILCGNGVSLESVKVLDNSAELMLKILKNCKKVQICASANQATGLCVAFGSSVSFQSHNNGKQRSRRARSESLNNHCDLVRSSPVNSPVGSPDLTESVDSVLGNGVSPYSYEAVPMSLSLSPRVVPDLELPQLDFNDFGARLLGEKRQLSELAPMEPLLPADWFELEETQRSVKRSRASVEIQEQQAAEEVFLPAFSFQHQQPQSNPFLLDNLFLTTPALGYAM